MRPAVSAERTRQRKIELLAFAPFGPALTFGYAVRAQLCHPDRELQID
ncbi:hypothetical protein [Streptomyces lydicus]|nr:hypothetical protein [Streptomyces lydicus]